MNKKKNRVGEKHFVSNGEEVTIIKDNGWKNCDILFKDGTIMRNIIYSHLKNRNVKKVVDIAGNSYPSCEGYEMIVLEDKGSRKCIIQFNDELKTIVKNVTRGNIQS